MDEQNLTELTASIVTAFVTNNRISADELPQMIQQVGSALWQSANPVPTAEPEVKRRRSVVRRTKGEEVADTPTDETPSEEIADESPETVSSVEEWKEDEMTGAKTPPAPMFE